MRKRIFDVIPAAYRKQNDMMDPAGSVETDGTVK